jgi:hypothetical protein
LFLNKFGTADTGTWFDILKDLTPWELEGGLERLKSMKVGTKFVEFPPNALQFRGLSLSFYNDLSLPSEKDAYQQVMDYECSGKAKWSHPVVKYLASKIGSEFYAINYEPTRRKIFTDKYKQVCHFVRQGYPLPEIKLMPRLTRQTPPEEARNHLNNLRNLLRIL